MTGMIEEKLRAVSRPEPIAALTFDYPLAWQAGLPLAALVLALWMWRQSRRDLARWRAATLLALRAAAQTCLATPGEALAQAFPSRPICPVLPFA